MKKLLFIFALAAISAITTSSFKPAQSANEAPAQTVVVALNDAIYSPEDVKKDDKKQKQAKTGSCCQAKAQKAECPEAQQKNCAASKPECPAAKKSEKK